MPPSDDKVEMFITLSESHQGHLPTDRSQRYVKRTFTWVNFGTYQPASWLFLQFNVMLQNPSRIVGAPCCRNWSILSKKNLGVILGRLGKASPPQSLTLRPWKATRLPGPQDSQGLSSNFPPFFRGNVELHGVYWISSRWYWWCHDLQLWIPAKLHQRWWQNMQKFHQAAQRYLPVMFSSPRIPVETCHNPRESCGKHLMIL